MISGHWVWTLVVLGLLGCSIEPAPGDARDPAGGGHGGEDPGSAGRDSGRAGESADGNGLGGERSSGGSGEHPSGGASGAGAGGVGSGGGAGAGEDSPDAGAGGADGSELCASVSCPADTPVCKSSGSRTACVECVQHADCQGAQSVCNQSQNHCVAPACQHGGTLVGLANGNDVCDCPPGFWGAECELTTYQISSSGYNTCALKSDGRVACWGWGQAVLPYDKSLAEPPGVFTSISGDGNGGCGLHEDGTIACWGHNLSGERDAPLGEFESLAYGGGTCALKNDGTAVCWGEYLPPIPAPPADDFAILFGGQGRYCGLRHDDDTIKCWGQNVHGEGSDHPGEFQWLALGPYFTCGIKADDTVECWGLSNEGAANAPPGKFVIISAGYDFACGVKVGGEVVCWGDNSYGQTDAPAGTFGRVYSGYRHSCGAKLDGTIVCWGGDYTQLAVPTGVFKEATVGSGSICGIKVDGSLSCWGAFGGLSDVPAGNDFTSIASGAHRVYALRSGGFIEGWFDPGWDAPVDPLPHSNGDFTSVAASFGSACGLKSNSTIECFTGVHYTPDGKFKNVSASSAVKADGTLVSWNNFLQNLPAGTFKSVTDSFYLGCAIRSDDTVKCWTSYEDYGQSNAPSGKFTRLAVGDAHACGLRPSSRVECWGNDGYAQAEPPSVPFSSLSAGESTTCGVDAWGHIQCWGEYVRPRQD